MRTNARRRCIDDKKRGGVVLVAQLLGSSSAPVQHGCLVVRHLDSSGDVSDWDPGATPFYNAGDAVIFGVLPAVDGPVSVEVWDGAPDQLLENVLFSERIASGSGRILVEDPNGKISIEVNGPPGHVILSVFVDDATWPENIQMIISSDSE